MSEQEGVVSANGASADSVFLGALEGLCFVLLFFSPILSLSAPGLTWLAVALLRVIVLGVVVFGADTRTEAYRFLGRAVPYQVPFWASALFFPLQAGQTYLALNALVLQMAILTVLPVTRCLGRLLGAEPLVYVVSVGWMLVLGNSMPSWWSGVVLVGFVLTMLAANRQRCWGWPVKLSHGLAVGAAWLVLFGLPPLCAADSGSALSPLGVWLLFLYFTAALTSIEQEMSSQQGEDVASLPEPRAGRAWLIWRKASWASLGWMMLVAVSLKRVEDVVLALALIPAVARSLEFAARGGGSATRRAWTTAGELTLLWIAAAAPLPYAWLVPAASGAGYIVLRLWGWKTSRCGDSALVQYGISQLEGSLREGLRLSAPKEFTKRVLEEAGTKSLDQDLTATAPIGFRDRLLQRLRDAGDAE